MYLCSNSEVYIQEVDFPNWFLFNLRGILEVDFQCWCIYFETQKYTWSRLSKFMNICTNSEVYLKLIS